jgi:cyanophycin synthetase
MEFGRIWTLRGPNRWAKVPVIEADVDLTAHEQLTGEALAALRQRVDEFVPPLPEEATLAHLLLALVQAQLEGIDCRMQFSAVNKSHRPGFYRVLFDYEEESLAQAALTAAHELCLALLAGQPVDVAAKVTALRHQAHEIRLGPSTRGIVLAARQRGIPVRRLTAGSLVQLGWGTKQRRIWTAETDQTPLIAETIAQDKELTRRLLSTVGVPVPYGQPVQDAEEAWAAAQYIGLPVVVKPQYGNQGRGVATNLRTREQVLAAYEAARQESAYIMVEKYIPGKDHRVLVVGGKVAAASLREPAHVVGDGVSTIAQLVAEANKDPRRSDGHATPLSFIKLDPISLGVLAEHGLTPESIPADGQKVLIRRNANLSTGGTATDVTDLVHPDVAMHCIEAARAVGLDVAGVDVVCEDIRVPLGEQDGGIVEVNAGPGLRMHLEPSSGQPRNVGEAIVNALFPPGEMGRIPVVAVTGVNGKTTTTRIISHILRTAGKFVGTTCTDGIYLNGRRTETRDCSGPQSARAVLMNPRVEVAVLETARGGILREGLGFDRCDIGIVTNIGKGDHLGLRGIETIEELADVKKVVVQNVAPTGYAVLNAADPLVVEMAGACPGQIVYFARDEHNPILAKHRLGGGLVAFVRHHKLVLAQESQEETLIDTSEVPFIHQHVAFQIDNALTAAAACWRLGMSFDLIRAGLRTFAGAPSESPGRFNVLPAGPSTIIVDYAHNPSAVSALVAGLDAFSHPHRTLVFSGCNRRDEDLLEMGETLGNAFERVLLYADYGHSGRADGELNAVLKQGLQKGKRLKEILELGSEREAIEKSLHMMQPGELLVLGVEAIEESLAFVQENLRGVKV